MSRLGQTSLEYFQQTSKLRLALYALCLALLAVGVYIILGVLLFDRSVWIDEAYLAGRLYYMSSPLDAFLLNFHTAIGRPLGFFLISKGFVSLFGYSEIPLRLVSTVPAILALGFAFWASLKLFKENGVEILLVVVLTAFNYFFIVNSAHYKAYSLEELVAVSLILVTANYISKQSAASMVLALAVATASLIFGNNSYFMAPWVFVVCFLLSMSGRKNIKLFWLMAVIGLAGATAVYFSFLYGHMAVYNSMFKRPFLDAYYQGGQGVWGWFIWVTGQLGNLTEAHLLSVKVPKPLWGSHLKLAWHLLSGLALLGVVNLAARRKAIGLVIAGPFVLILLANALGKYPMGTGRWTSHLGMNLIFMAAFGLEAILHLCRKARAAKITAVSLALLFSLSLLPAPAVMSPSFWIPQHITTRSVKQVMEDVKAEVEGPMKGKPLLVHFLPYSNGEFDFYARSDVYQKEFAFLNKNTVKEWKLDGLGPHPKYKDALEKYRELLRTAQPPIYIVVTHARADCWRALMDALKMEDTNFTRKMYLGGSLIKIPELAQRKRR